MAPPDERQSMLFSATLDKISRRIAIQYLNDAEFITLTPDQLTVDTITQELYRVKSHIKDNLLLGILKKEKPRNALIFTNMRHVAQKLARIISLNGFPCRYLSGDLPQAKRLQVMDGFMAGKFPFLVATDVAARGLHIDDLEMVINYDLPQDSENYVHRIGRTARAGNTGKAVSFACEKFGGHLGPIESYIGMRIPEKTAGIEMFARDESLEHEARAKGRGTGHRRSNPHPRDRKSRFPRSSGAEGGRPLNGRQTDTPRPKPGDRFSSPEQRLLSPSNRHSEGRPSLGPPPDARAPKRA
jgi:ATP-dependent RNA helicase RhlB